jgi:hypothetical protein
MPAQRTFDGNSDAEDRAFELWSRILSTVRLGDSAKNRQPKRRLSSCIHQPYIKTMLFQHVEYRSPPVGGGARVAQVLATVRRSNVVCGFSRATLSRRSLFCAAIGGISLTSRGAIRPSRIPSFRYPTGRDSLRLSSFLLRKSLMTRSTDHRHKRYWIHGIPWANADSKKCSPSMSG